MNEWDMLTGDNHDAIYKFYRSEYDSALNIVTEANAVKNIVDLAIKEALAYGN